MCARTASCKQEVDLLSVRRILRTPGRKTISRSVVSHSGVKGFQSYAMEKMLHGR